MHASSPLSAALAATVVVLVSLCPPAQASPTIGAPAPVLVGPELDGRTFDLAALRGTTVIVNFWATWCTPCRQEMPALNAFYRRYHAQGLEVIGISADRPRDRDDVAQTMQAFIYPAAMLRDLTQNGFGDPGAIPITYVIDTRGIVRAIFTPNETGVTEQALDRAVLPLLAGATQPRG